MPYRDTARDLAIELIAEIGWLWAVVWVTRRVARSRSWRESGQGVRLLVAVVFA